MSSLVIVAIPEEQDRVWKISSEPVPHLTLLYLGDDVNQVQNLDQIMQFVDHAVTLSEHGSFYLDVERRGTLGDAEADVLFFNKRSWNLKWIRQFRGQLLQNQAIRTAFDSTDQILEAPQEWLPHLTLGYPATPAKADPNEEPFGHPLYSVCFDRIAVWAEKDNGPEFQLEWPERELDGDLALAYADQQKAKLMHDGLLLTPPASMVRERGSEFVEQHGVNAVHSVTDEGAAFILEHFGTKGMRWGFRKDRPSTPISATTGHSLIKGKAKIQVEGGEHHPAHEDAVKVAKSTTKLKKSGSAALSNQELRDVANRLQLENQVSLLTSHKGKLWVQKQLDIESSNLARQGVREGIKRGAKRGAKAAGVAAALA